ncbi:MAG: extracellular solute-binding protein [Chloroflexota bacterium]|nr:extracellular solute-binding protein [Chloroflexota bacterium]
MNQRDRKQRLYVAEAGRLLNRGKISRREFMSRAGAAGFGISAASMMRWDAGSAVRANPAKANRSLFAQSDDMNAWLTEVGGRFAGTTVRLSSESTAPSQITSDLIADNFTALTGIEVAWEQTPLDQVLSKITQDTATESASNDIYYLDQSWLGRFALDVVDVRQQYISDTGSDLNMPGYDFADFIPELVPAIAEYQGTLVGVPFDIPIFIMVYRRDVFEQLGLSAPTTMPEYLAAAQAINAAGLTNADGSRIYGTAGQWRSGHYALQCDWTAWLWSHGGSHTGPDGTVTINDENAIAGAEYMMALGETMPSGATTWDWSGQGDAIGQGLAGVAIHWGEFFPGFDNPETSKVAGLMETADLPMEVALRSKDECSFDETPAIGHQGGSCLALSRYSEVQDASWVFLQWATSKETMAQAAAASNTPVRQSTFDDPRVTEKATVVAGTTRHFPAILKAIKERMGTEPHFPSWADVSSTGAVIPTELGLMTTGTQDIPTTLNNIAAAIEEAIADDM